MALFRFLAWLVLALAIALLGADAMSSLENGEPVLRSTGEILELVGLSLDGGEGDAPGILGTVLSLPLWAVFGLLGVILVLIFRPIE